MSGQDTKDAYNALKKLSSYKKAAKFFKDSGG